MTDTRLRYARASLCLLLHLAALTTAGANATAPTPAAEPNASERNATAEGVPVYKPPAVGAPRSTVGGATRGDDTSPVIVLLAPRHVGLTTQAQPRLYWHLAHPVNESLQFTLTEAGHRDPVLLVPLPSGLGAGLHVVRLTDHETQLRPGVQYEWSIEPASPSGRRDEPECARAAIQRIAASAALEARLRRAPEPDAVFIYAAEGVWYDALATLSEAIAAHPEIPKLRAQRAALLSQVGLRRLPLLD